MKPEHAKWLNQAIGTTSAAYRNILAAQDEVRDLVHMGALPDTVHDLAIAAEVAVQALRDALRKAGEP